MDSLDTREWLLTNGLGSYANGTISDAHTRIYHGWLVAARQPPVQRRLLLARIDASLDNGRQRYDLGTNYWEGGKISPTGYRLLQSFQRYPTPTWTWGGRDWSLTRRLLMPYAWHQQCASDAVAGNSCTIGRQRLLVQYRYQGDTTATLNLRPLIADRSLHYQQSAADDLRFSQIVGDRQVMLQAIRPQQAGTTWTLRWTDGSYYPEGVWYWNYHYPEETKRGLGDREDLYSPGYLVVSLEPGAGVTLEASLDDGSAPLLSEHSFEDALDAEASRLRRYWQQVQPLRQSTIPSQRSGFPTAATKALSAAEAKLVDSSGSSNVTALQRLLQAGDQFVVYRQSVASPTLLAGYPWFGDWGRDALIALPGLTLTTGRFELAKGMLQTFA
ncbi:MAG: glycogen debranching enzyme N-terminal domain-containing protein, partial [Elainellaceae cyanobacterium]